MLDVYKRQPADHLGGDGAECGARHGEAAQAGEQQGQLWPPALCMRQRGHGRRSGFEREGSHPLWSWVGKRRIAVGDLSHCGVPGGRAGLHAPEPLAERFALWGAVSYTHLLDEQRRPTCVAGVPPDAFSETGQLWGNPLYDWEEMERTDFALSLIHISCPLSWGWTVCG